MQGKHSEIKVNDIFYSSWGYDQTNISFYKVVKKTAKTCTLLEVESEVVTEDGYRNDYTTAVIPTDVPYKHGDGPVVRLIKPCNRNGFYFKVSRCQHAYRWDGNPKRETTFGYGH